MRWVGHVARMGEERKAYKVLVRKPEGKRRLVTRRRRWEDGIRMDLTEIRWGVWIGFDWLRITVVNAVMNLRVLSPRN
jgi:hypothetical protein